ncbi:aspartate--tRNA ligase [Candidatus Woesearchaeota archaeon]|jgi:aspartyl-tRNA synthetase|nr:aspartate--tRNA ligase [Candidatus Woesearchaeota archaeon]MBT5271795.1 aspartate--tRNA ligase [Candidatus Woesearchaeota archaeon]MBT6040864.1 aspartate--tRNA ligase [Candidatus Woesearchaeota archaeon]MBT6336447.1 aspartate--tRNA ligase [Candidatus Woesearchaeota archaeon]MBT7926773.1 aspartate--tRNA ligase [Candidatus Woesearchaeota archaeon]
MAKATAYRTNTCGELALKDNGKKVTLCGWVQHVKNLGGLIFFYLKDRYGITQVVFDPKNDADAHKAAESLKREDVIQVTGRVRTRPQGQDNVEIITGSIEVICDRITVLNKSETIPIDIEEQTTTTEEMRLKYRYLDLRRNCVQKNIITRHKIVKATRDYFDKQGFLEIETPILAKSTPEGARDYLVPSRVHKGKFYALPQSPQIFKQLLMLSGFDRYVQIARCFRDEDLRADRQPEFTQIDVEMSFVDEENVYEIMEGLMKDVFKAVDVKIKTPFPRITFADAMAKYGSDKPDVRFGMQLKNISEIGEKSSFKIFTETIKNGGSIKCINARGCAKFSRKEVDELEKVAKIYDAKGLAWVKVEGTDTKKKLEGMSAKFFSEELQKQLMEKVSANIGDLLLIVGDHKHHIVDIALGQLRLFLAKKLELIPEDEWSFIWVVDFPMMEYDEDAKRHIAMHHPFTSPKDEDMGMLLTDPSKVRAKAYDLALNGVELGGGSIRIHSREIQENVFKAIGLKDDEIKSKFGFLLDAFKYGAPPHGGIAFGLDRLAAMVCKEENIREVIAFPKTKNAESLMESSPSNVDNEQLDEVGVKLK